MKLAAALLLAILVAAPVSAATSSVQGTATWWCAPPAYPRCSPSLPAGPYAAAGSELIAVLGPGWKGKWVEVTGENGVTVRAKLITSCKCKGDRIIDLYSGLFRQLAPLTEGVISVSVAEVRPDIAGALPPTDSANPTDISRGLAHGSVLDFILALLGAFVAAPFSPVIRRLR